MINVRVKGGSPSVEMGVLGIHETAIPHEFLPAFK